MTQGITQGAYTFQARSPACKPKSKTIFLQRQSNRPPAKKLSGMSRLSMNRVACNSFHAMSKHFRIWRGSLQFCNIPSTGTWSSSLPDTTHVRIFYLLSSSLVRTVCMFICSCSLGEKKSNPQAITRSEHWTNKPLPELIRCAETQNYLIKYNLLTFSFSELCQSPLLNQTPFQVWNSFRFRGVRSITFRALIDRSRPTRKGTCVLHKSKNEMD